MLRILIAQLTTSLSSLKSRRELAIENLVLRKQLAVYKRKVNRPDLNREIDWRPALDSGVDPGVTGFPMRLPHTTNKVMTGRVVAV